MTQGMSQEKNLLIFKNSAESSDLLAKKIPQTHHLTKIWFMEGCKYNLQLIADSQGFRQYL